MVLVLFAVYPQLVLSSLFGLQSIYPILKDKVNILAWKFGHKRKKVFCRLILSFWICGMICVQTSSCLKGSSCNCLISISLKGAAKKLQAHLPKLGSSLHQLQTEHWRSGDICLPLLDLCEQYVQPWIRKTCRALENSLCRWPLSLVMIMIKI